MKLNYYFALLMGSVQAAESWVQLGLKLGEFHQQMAAPSQLEKAKTTWTCQWSSADCAVLTLSPVRAGEWELDGEIRQQGALHLISHRIWPGASTPAELVDSNGLRLRYQLIPRSTLPSQIHLQAEQVVMQKGLLSLRSSSAKIRWQNSVELDSWSSFGPFKEDSLGSVLNALQMRWLHELDRANLPLAFQFEKVVLHWDGQKARPRFALSQFPLNLQRRLWKIADEELKKVHGIWDFEWKLRREAVAER